MSLKAQILDTYSSGSWQVYVYPDDHSPATVTEDSAPFDVTFFRGAQTQVGTLSWTDPFGPADAQITFPHISYFDRLGQGDLWWCVPEANVDIAYVAPNGYVWSVWEGYVVSREYGVEDAGSSLTLTCVGAMRQLDNYLATPEWLYGPIPFEYAIARQFANRPDLRLASPRVEWPTWWTKTFAYDPTWRAKPWLAPTGVRQGDNWTGMVTRNTGQFEPVLTGYISSLLSAMHTPKGQFTLLLDPGRKPALRHRDYQTVPVEGSTYEVDLLWPGVELSLTEDFTQHLNVVYANGKALNGSTYSGMRVANDGSRTWYEPYAARRAVHPARSDNMWLDATRMRKEVLLTMADGVPEDEAYRVARGHLARFSDPGLTGSVTLRTDPLLSGTPFPRAALRAGSTLQVRSLFGFPEGRLLHITEANYNGADGSVSLTLDSKYRDQLTVEEVRMRGRDALTPTRMIATGNWNPSVPDQLFPWSYEMGAGFIPMGAQTLFRGIDNSEQFPWSNWTQLHPPKDPAWRDCYVRIGPRSENPDENWSTPAYGTARHSVLFSQEGSARLIQIAAYDRDGIRMAVPFHVSLWTSNSANASAAPSMTEEQATAMGYPGKGGQHHPFFPNAWELLDESGMSQSPQMPQAEATAGIVVGWGTGYEKAGYWPGSSADPNDNPTGMMVDQSGFSWSLTDEEIHVDPREPMEVNTQTPSRASLYLLVYCEDQGEQEVFFLGRVFRAEPGVS